MTETRGLAAILEHPDVDRLIKLALDEDGTHDDLTTKAAVHGMSSDTGAARARATIVAKQPCVAAGFPLVSRILSAAGMTESVKATALRADGHHLNRKEPWIICEGSGADLLRVERTLLNFLMRMSGIATETARAVALTEGTPCKILHSRKTAPGHRRTDVYAVLAGGGHPHRLNLADAVLVKENHLRYTPSFQNLIDGIESVRKRASLVEIEVTDFTELKHAMMAKPDRVLLDNFSAADVEKAVELFGGTIELEASGGINLTNIGEYAKTGVNYVSMGWITHSAPAADLSMLFDFRQI